MATCSKIAVKTTQTAKPQAPPLSLDPQGRGLFCSHRDQNSAWHAEDAADKTCATKKAMHCVEFSIMIFKFDPLYVSSLGYVAGQPCTLCSFPFSTLEGDEKVDLCPRGRQEPIDIANPFTLFGDNFRILSLASQVSALIASGKSLPSEENSLERISVPDKIESSRPTKINQLF
ncbi:Mkrn2 Opposite Strand Protein [Manis pentadactyla]|nr:Mkrn2 Opposite Strand Protein [Manis pentadactyla]